LESPIGTSADEEMMARYFCHEHPDVLVLETDIVDAQPGAVVLRRTPFYPGGAGQLADRGRLCWSEGETRIVAIESKADRVWHKLAEPSTCRARSRYSRARSSRARK
jgi:misacylated tRNA(Ala) deacylase